MAETQQSCLAKGLDFDEANEMCVAFGTTGTTGTYRGPRTLTLDEISIQIDALDAQLLEQGFEEGTAEYIAAQEQARAEFVKYITDHPALNFSEEDFAAAVGAEEGSAFTPAQAIAQYYDYDFTGKDLFNLAYGDTISTTVTSYNASPQGKAAAAEAAVSESIFGDGTAAKSWVPQAITRANVQSPTDYEQLTEAQLAPYLPTTPYDLTKVSQNTPAYTAATAGLPSTLFDAINFPQNVITRGTPVISRGFDALGRPNTAITMGQSAATPTGPNIGNLTTTTQFPSTGMGIGPTGLGTTTVGTMGTTGNIVSTGADELVTWVDEDGALQTSSINPTVLNTGSGLNEGVTVTTGGVDLSTVPGSVAFCKNNPDHASCQTATGGTCPVGSELEGQAVPANGDCNPAATAAAALAAQKIVCENAGGTWDDATGCTGGATTKTCELGSQREGEVIAIDGDCNPCNTGYTWDRAQGKCVLSDSTLHCNPGQVKRMDADGNEYCEDKAQCGAYQTYDELNNACITKTAQQVIGDLYLAEEAAIGPNAALADRQAAARRVGDAIAVYGAATDQEFTSTQLTEWLNPFVGTGGTGYSVDTGLSTGIAIEPDDPNTLIDESKVSEYEASKYLQENPIAGVTASMDAAEIAAWDAYFAGTGPLPATTAAQATAGGIDWTGATTGGAGTGTVTTGGTGTGTGTVTTGGAGTGTLTPGGTDTTPGGTGTAPGVDPYATQKAACTLEGKVWDDTTNQCGGVAGTAVTGADVTGTALTGAGGVTDPLGGFSADIGSTTAAEVSALVDMINKGQTTVAAVAARYNVPEADIQSYLNSLTATGATTTGATTVVDPYLTQKATCATNGGTWDGVNNLCVPAIDTTALQNIANTNLAGVGGLYPGVGVVGAKTPGGPALPTNLATSLVPGIDSLNFGDGQLINTGGFGFAANTAAGATPGGPYPGTGPGFKYGGEVEGKEGKSNQRQNAVGSRLMRHAGLGQYRDMIPPEMLSSLDRIMDRKG